MENYKYRLEELIDGINQSISNIDEVVSKQEQLILKLDDEESFKDFVSELKKAIENELQQRKILKERYENLNKCIELLNNNEICVEFLAVLSDSLGLFSKTN